MSTTYYPSIKRNIDEITEPASGRFHYEEDDDGLGVFTDGFDYLHVDESGEFGYVLVSYEDCSRNTSLRTERLLARVGGEWISEHERERLAATWPNYFQYVVPGAGIVVRELTVQEHEELFDVDRQIDVLLEAKQRVFRRQVSRLLTDAELAELRGVISERTAARRLRAHARSGIDAEVLSMTDAELLTRYRKGADIFTVR